MKVRKSFYHVMYRMGDNLSVVKFQQERAIQYGFTVSGDDLVLFFNLVLGGIENVFSSFSLHFREIFTKSPVDGMLISK